MKMRAYAVLVAGFLGLAAAYGAELGEPERNALIGVWVGAMPKDPPGSIELTITPTKITGRDPRTGRSLGQGPYQLDPAAKTLDATRMESSGRGKQYRGIYALNGRILQWCVTSRKERPAALEHRPGRDAYLMLLQKRN